MKNTFVAQIVVTTKCNLGCKYCYMKNVDKKMSYSIISKIHENIDKVLARYDTNTYSVSYFGGEPLTNWDLIVKADELFREDPRCVFRVIISNGLLLDNNKVDYIKKNKIGFSWSFDGLWNDINRVSVDGKGTLKQYLEKIDIIRKVCPYNCKVMVSPTSLDTLVENYEFIKSLGITGIDYSLVRDDIWSDIDVEIFKTKLHDLAEHYIKDCKDGLRMSIGFFTLAMLDMYIGEIKGKRPFSCFAGNSGLGFMPDGIAYACARFGSENKLPIYNVVNNTWNEENYNTLNDPRIYDPRQYPECLNCSIRQYCNGGCNYEFIKNNYSVLSNVCELFKAIYKESLYIVDKLKDNAIFREMLDSAIKNVG